MAAAEVISHTPLILPQPRDVPLQPSPHQSLLPRSAKSKKKERVKETGGEKSREKPSAGSHNGRSSGIGGQRSEGPKKPEKVSLRRWNWTSLTDTSASLHPPVFTKDGSHFFSVAGSTIKIHSTSSGKVVSTLPRSQDEGHKDAITSAVLNAQNSFQLITASLDGTIKVWDFLEGVLLRTIDLDQPIHNLCAHEKLKGYIFVAASKSKEVPANLPSGTKGSQSNLTEEEGCIVLRVSLKYQGSSNGSKAQKSSQVVAVGKTRRTTGLAISASGERLIAVAGHKAYVAQTSALKSGFMKFVSPEILTCLAVHPSEEYFATGDVKGVVRLWYCLDPNLVKAVGVEKKSQTSALHWHAHSVSSVAFTTNGAYLLSGGEEAVLVIWQLHTGKREFVPRVGSPISSIAVAPPRVSEEEYLLGLADATYAFVSSTTLKLARVFAHLKLEPSLSTAVPSSSSTPLAFHSLSETLVLPSSHPSSLQTFSPSSFALVAELEVSPSNRVSRRDEKFLEPSRVECAVISPGGEWMATIDSREGDEYFRGEIYLKFWCWDKRNAFWILNTRIDRPHGLRKITSMSFSPDSSNIQLVTTGADGNVKGWRIRAVKDKKGNQEVSWLPKSSFSFKSNIPKHVSWAPDGSLLSVTVGSCVVLYDPYTNVPRHTFVCHESQRPYQAHFIGRSGRFLVVIGGLDLVVWNVMSQSVLWHVRSNRPYETVVPHPYWDTFITVHPSLSTPSHAVVTIFHALSPVPQLERALPFALRNLIWYTHQSTPVDSESFSLVGLTHSYNVILMGDGVGAQEGLTCHTKTLEKGQVPLRKSLFEEMFGVPALTSVSRDHTPVNPGTALPWRGSETTTFFDAPSHLMPPIHTFFDPFVDSFLHLRTSDEEHPNVPDDDGQGADAEMSVDEEASFVKSTIASADGVLEAFVPVFKEIAESSDYPCQAAKASAPPKPSTVHSKPSPKSTSRVLPSSPKSHQSSMPITKLPNTTGPAKAGKKRSRPSMD